MSYIANESMKYVPKGWGWERWIWNDDRYCGKILHFLPGKKCSWHYHAIKDEVLYVSSGQIMMQYGEEDDIDKASVVILMTGDAFHVRTGLRHRMTAVGEAEIFEVSTHHEDSDSIRVIPGD
jgi:mannose-6-phosphate isomerase-like protein (cupin superfamily)